MLPEKFANLYQCIFENNKCEKEKKLAFAYIFHYQILRRLIHSNDNNLPLFLTYLIENMRHSVLLLKIQSLIVASTLVEVEKILLLSL